VLLPPALNTCSIVFADTFLDPDKILVHQDIGEDDTVFLKKQYFFSDHYLEEHPNSLKYSFIQGANDLMDGHYAIPFDELVEFSALLLQFCFGDYTEKNFKGIE